MRIRFGPPSSSAQSTPVKTWPGAVAEKVYSKTSRRSFLAKAGAGLLAVGVGDLAVAGTASAAPGCCTGTSCSSLGLSCGCPAGSCPPGWTWDGYTWTCCGPTGTHVLFCSDCTTQQGGFCVCGCYSSSRCNLTMSELAKDYPILRR